MATRNISLPALAPAASLTGSEIYYAVQNGEDVQVSGFQIQSAYHNGPGVRAINIFDFLAASEQADVIARTGLKDLTSAFTKMFAQMENGGNLLRAPAGRYVTSGGFTIAKPFRFEGDGSGRLDSSSAITQIECNSTSAKLFTVTADDGLFEHLGLFQTGGTAVSGSSLIFVNSASNQLQSIDYFDMTINGGYDQVDVAVGNSWSMLSCILLNGVHWGIRCRNVLNADAGDWHVDGCTIYLATGAAAGIEWESSGGPRITNNKINSNTGGTYTDGIVLNCTSGTTVEWQIIGNNIEGCSGVPLNVTQSPVRGVITSNLLNAQAGTNEAIRLTQAANVIITGNQLNGNNTAITPITFGNVQNLTVGPNQTSGFASSTLSYLGSGTPSGIVDLSEVAAPNTFDPANSKASLAFSNGNLTVSGTTISATGAVARALRSGFQQATYCEFKFTTIGSAGGSGVGIINATQDPHLGHYLGDTGSNSLGYYGDGSVFFNNATLTTLAAYTSNDVIGMHVHHGLKKVWFRKNAGGWNNDVIANQNPDTGVGGITFAALGDPISPAIDIESATGVCVANFGAAAYAQTPTVTAGNW